MEWSRQKVNSQNLNNGQEYTTDSQVSIEQLNAMVNSGLYSQDIVDGLKAQPYSASATYKYPNIVTQNGSSYMAIYAVDGVYTEFSNIAPPNATYWATLAQKGQDGAKGDSGITNAGLSNTYGNSDINGYTQRAINGLVRNYNYLTNSNFAINQRGLLTYTQHLGYTVDRWLLVYGKLTINEDGSVTHTATNNWQGIRQRIEHPSRLAGQTFTLSAMSPSTTGKTVSMVVQRIGQLEGPVITNGQVISKTVKLPVDLTDDDILEFVLYTQNTGEQNAVTWKWAQFEPGEVATSYTLPLIAEELPKCQRFYQLRTNSYVFPTSALDRTPVMRENGTIGTTTINGIAYKYCDAEL